MDNWAGMDNWAEALDPNTGSIVVVFAFPGGGVFYMLNGGPIKHVQLEGPWREDWPLLQIARDLLLEHLRTPAPTYTEELTLP